MRIRDRLDNAKPCFSFEFFPPKTDAAMDELFRTVSELAPLEPGFVSVTYGAAGGTRDLTVEVVTRIQRNLGLPAMAHLTCASQTRDEIRTLLDRLRDEGIQNVLALRGDPRPGDRVVPGDQGFASAKELIEFIRGEGYPFCVGAAAYPEGHPSSPSRRRRTGSPRRG
mgnify:CR=1 FL=1